MARKTKRKIRRITRASKDSAPAKATKSALSKTYVKVILIAVFVLLIILAIYLFNRFRTYGGYKVINSYEVKNDEDSKIVPFGKFIVKYNRNGITYKNGDETSWDETHEMKNPKLDTCGEYLCIADKNANDIFIYDKEGKKGGVTTTYPIVKAEIGKQGVVAALLKDKDVNYIEVFDKEGNLLISHKSFLTENGYPLNFSLSDNGEKMIVSYVQLSAGKISSKVVFFNFGNAGKNKKDRVVATFDQYKDQLVPFVQFTSNDRAIAVGEHIISTYKVGDNPRLGKETKFDGEAQKIFYNESYIGLAFRTNQTKKPYRIDVYNSRLRRVMSEKVTIALDTVKFAGNNVLMYNDKAMQIISLHGVVKFNHSFKKPITDIIPLGDTEFFITTKESIERVKLR